VLYSVVAAFFASLLALVVTPCASAGFLGKALGWRSLRFFGKYSYGIYVYHFPIYIASGIFLQDHGIWSRMRGSTYASLLFVGANAAVSVLVALASYHLYEKHFLKLKKYFPEKTGAALPAPSDETLRSMSNE
jgi:peptidoglycan/LPS O-acetylase OafA/YrhL